MHILHIYIICTYIICPYIICTYFISEIPNSIIDYIIANEKNIIFEITKPNNIYKELSNSRQPENVLIYHIIKS